MRTASLEDKLLLNVIMKILICNGARTRYDCKVGHSFQLLKTLFFLYTIVAVGLSPPKVENTMVKSNHAQLPGLCVRMTFACPALDGDDIEQVVYSH